MSAPYFKVGEEVILVSLENPELNGECTIESILRGNFVSDSDGIRMNAYSYVTTIPGTKGSWSERALRKKHEGGEDFKSLMNNLKSPISQGEVQ